MNRIRIDRDERLEADKSVLPPDAKFKGFEEAVVQDIRLTTEPNIEAFWAISAFSSRPAGKAHGRTHGMDARISPCRPTPTQRFEP